MADTGSHWRIIPNASNDQAHPILMQDPVWNSFALADLESPMREYSQFAIASEEDGDKHAICLIVRHPIIGQVLSPYGAAEGVAAILSHIDLLEHPLIQAQEIHLTALQHHYQPQTTWRTMLRMAIIPGQEQFLTPAHHQSVRQLTAADLPALRDLYASNPENTFSPDLFPQGLYFGAYQGECIIAAGGTHALSPAQRLAVLGNIFTAPEARGQGYATVITASLVAALFKQHLSHVVLNVFEDNVQAIRVYQRVGFQTHHRLTSGKALLFR
jgi:RimJ/RimL family protein N-acetyltransferase